MKQLWNQKFWPLSSSTSSSCPKSHPNLSLHCLYPPPPYHYAAKWNTIMLYVGPASGLSNSINGRNKLLSPAAPPVNQTIKWAVAAQKKTLPNFLKCNSCLNNRTVFARHSLYVCVGLCVYSIYYATAWMDTIRLGPVLFYFFSLLVLENLNYAQHEMLTPKTLEKKNREHSFPFKNSKWINFFWW